MKSKPFHYPHPFPPCVVLVNTQTGQAVPQEIVEQGFIPSRESYLHDWDYYRGRIPFLKVKRTQP